MVSDCDNSLRVVSLSSFPSPLQLPLWLYFSLTRPCVSSQQTYENNSPNLLPVVLSDIFFIGIGMIGQFL